MKPTHLTSYHFHMLFSVFNHYNGFLSGLFLLQSFQLFVWKSPRLVIFETTPKKSNFLYYYSRLSKYHVESAFFSGLSCWLFFYSRMFCSSPTRISVDPSYLKGTMPSKLKYQLPHFIIIIIVTKCRLSQSQIHKFRYHQTIRFII